MTHPHVFVDAAAARSAAYERQGGYCLRCHSTMSPDRYEAHHRRRRRVLGWCLCNVVALHPRCHTQGPLAVHDHPADAVQRGLIVPTHSDEPPCEIPVAITWPWSAPALLSCDGMVCSIDSADVCS